MNVCVLHSPCSAGNPIVQQHYLLCIISGIAAASVPWNPPKVWNAIRLKIYTFSMFILPSAMNGLYSRIQFAARQPQAQITSMVFRFATDKPKANNWCFARVQMEILATDMVSGLGQLKYLLPLTAFTGFCYLIETIARRLWSGINMLKMKQHDKICTWVIAFS